MSSQLLLVVFELDYALFCDNFQLSLIELVLFSIVNSLSGIYRPSSPPKLKYQNKLVYACKVEILISGTPRLDCLSGTFAAAASGKN